jgi:SAM-dependent methyltransferase
MRAEAVRHPHPRVEYVAATAERLPLRGASIGAAWLSTVIHHVGDLAVAGRELRRVLRPGAPVLIRSAFPGRIEGITLFRFFPAAGRVAETFPSVDQVVETFGRAGFDCESLAAVAQVTATDLASTRGRVALRADTTLRGISDIEFEQGLRALDAAIAGGEGGDPVIDSLDLLVLR